VGRVAEERAGERKRPWRDRERKSGRESGGVVAK